MPRYTREPFTRSYLAVPPNAIDGYVSDGSNVVSDEVRDRCEPRNGLPFRPKSQSFENNNKVGPVSPASNGERERERRVVHSKPPRDPYEGDAKSHNYACDSDSSPPSPFYRPKTFVQDQGGQYFGNSHIQNSSFDYIRGQVNQRASFATPNHQYSAFSSRNTPSSSSCFDHPTPFHQDEDDQEDDFAFDHRTHVASDALAPTSRDFAFVKLASASNINRQADFNFNSTQHKVTYHSPVYRTPSPPTLPPSSSSSTNMHIITPTISWSSGNLGYLGHDDHQKFIKLEDEDQFTYSDHEAGDQGRDREHNGGFVYVEDDENEYGGVEEANSGRVWFAGSGRDEWCKMSVDVEEQLKAQKLADAEELETPMQVHSGRMADRGEETKKMDLGSSEEPRKMSIKEYVEKRESLPHLSDDEVASMFGDDVADDEVFVDLDNMECERTLVHYEEVLVSIIRRLPDVKATERVQLEIKRSEIISTIRLIKANIEAKKRRNEVAKTPEVTAVYPTPPASQGPDASERKDMTANTAAKRKREDDEQGDRTLGAEVIDKDAPKPKRKRRTAAEIALDKETKLKEKEVKAAAKIAAQQEKEAKAAAIKADREAKKAAREAEKQRLKDEKAAEKERNKTPAQRAAEARREAAERERIAKARGIKTAGAASWKKRAPGEVGLWNKRCEVTAAEQEVEQTE